MLTKIIAFTGILLCSCKAPEETTILPLDTAHIEYFGFTVVDTYWDDPTDAETKTNYIDEVAPFSNVADILVVDPTDNLISRMEAMQQLQMKSILHLSEIFFELEGTDAPSGTDYKLRSDYQSRWDEFSGTNKLPENQNLVQAFYIGEEPTWNGITFQELQLVTDHIKMTLPTIPVILIEAYPALNDLQLPASVDWVGFDHYFIKDPMNDATFNTELAILKSKLSDDQKLILIMDTHYIDFVHGAFGNIAITEMGDIAKSYYELAKSEPKTIALLGYFWPSGFDDDSAIGARHMPELVQQQYRLIGKEITGKN